jgi:3-oxoacyl-[acyl-carrier-protein] synthase-3
MPPVYIIGLGTFLPNDPVDNDRAEDVLGQVANRSSRVKRWVHNQNGIQTRYYALDPATGRQTHTNAEMTAAAVGAALADAGVPLSEIECLVCGTSIADQVLPNHAVMVHGLLGGHPMEVACTSGVCCSGMTAFKYALMNVASGQVRMAVSTGSDVGSVIFRAGHFRAQMDLQRNEKRSKELTREPTLPFENEFLRWMLSDGAGAWVVADRPREGRLSLRVDWIDLYSFAHEAESCMYFGANKREDGSLKGFLLVDDPNELARDGYLSLWQDLTALQKYLGPLCGRACLESRRRHQLSPDQIDWVLPHYSSEAFSQPFYDGLAQGGFEVPRPKWFTNLRSKGNTGAASIYIILEELVSSGRAKRGDRILCFVPESSRFSFALAHLTAV